ncbi:restriction endonuclease subunit S [Maribacter polysiphoniae]|uniref:restriction endonuclease subunit S n=1 Tax=Maribacter polysiphoniae TaxID=429344 RepID=UPI0023534331|nr:restriction endonuclease subunit S [Maribacter polysiphoniae]
MMQNITATKEHQGSRLGEIPDGWTTPKINEVFQFINTTSFSRNQLNYDADNELFYIHYGDIHATYKKPLLDFEIETNIPRLINEVELPNSVQYLKDGDVIIADASEDYEGVGEAIEIKNLNGKAAISGLHTFALRDLDNKTVAGFRTYIFKNPNVKKALKTIATGSKVYGISKGNIQKFKIVLPPLPEQQKIAQILATWDVAINKQEALIAQKQEQKKGLMQQLLTGKKRFAGFEDEWEEVRLKNILEYQQPTKYIVEDDSYSDSNKTPVLTANKSFVLGYTNETEGIYKALPIILFDDFTTDNKWVDFPFKVKSSAIKILKLKNKEFNLRFIFERMQLLHFNKTDHKRYYISEYQYLKFDCPKLKEQQKIAEVLTAADNEITALQQQLQKLKNQKQGLMQQLLTGKIRVKI